MFKSRRSQAALEYLITYGWAFLVILGAVAVLGYFGFLNPDKYVPESCEFGEQLICVDQYMDVNDRVIFRFKNNFEADITVTGADGDDITAFVGDPGSGGPVDIPMGEIRQVEVTANGLTEGSKARLRLSIEFERTGGTQSHNVYGTVFGEVTENLNP